MLSLQDENMYQMIVHSNVHCNMSYTTSAQTRSKIKWVFPNLLFSVVHMDISRSLFCVHCRSYILNNN